MILLDLDPNIVKPGYTPLIILIVLAAAVVLLYLSMRKQVRRISALPSEKDLDPTTGEVLTAVPVPPSAPKADTADRTSTD